MHRTGGSPVYKMAGIRYPAVIGSRIGDRKVAPDGKGIIRGIIRKIIIGILYFYLDLRGEIIRYGPGNITVCAGIIHYAVIGIIPAFLNGEP